MIGPEGRKRGVGCLEGGEEGLKAKHSRVRDASGGCGAGKLDLGCPYNVSAYTLDGEGVCVKGNSNGPVGMKRDAGADDDGWGDGDVRQQRKKKQRLILENLYNGKNNGAVEVDVIRGSSLNEVVRWDDNAQHINCVEPFDGGMDTEHDEAGGEGDHDDAVAVDTNRNNQEEGEKQKKTGGFGMVKVNLPEGYHSSVHDLRVPPVAVPPLPSFGTPVYDNQDTRGDGSRLHTSMALVPYIPPPIAVQPSAGPPSLTAGEEAMEVDDPS